MDDLILKAHDAAQDSLVDDIKRYKALALSVWLVHNSDPGNQRAIAATWLTGLWKPNETFLIYSDIYGEGVVLLAHKAAQFKNHVSGKESTLEAIKSFGHIDPEPLNIAMALWIAEIFRVSSEGTTRTRAAIEELVALVAFFDKHNHAMRGFATENAAKIAEYMNNVWGSAPDDTPKLSSGHPSTLGAYRFLAGQAFGEGSLAQQYIQEMIDKSSDGAGEQVLADESQMIMLLKSRMASPLEVH